MSSRKEKIELEVQKTLDSFSQADRLTPGPWFASKIQSRLDATDPAPSRLGESLVFRLLRPALLTLIVLLNLVTAVAAFRRSEQNSETREAYVSVFASEYAYTTDDMLYTLDEQ